MTDEISAAHDQPLQAVHLGSHDHFGKIVCSAFLLLLLVSALHGTRPTPGSGPSASLE